MAISWKRTSYVASVFRRCPDLSLGAVLDLARTAREVGHLGRQGKKSAPHRRVDVAATIVVRYANDSAISSFEQMREEAFPAEI